MTMPEARSQMKAIIKMSWLFWYLQLSEVHSSQKTASQLEIQETAAAEVDRLNHLEHLDLFFPKMEVVTQELLKGPQNMWMSEVH